MENKQSRLIHFMPSLTDVAFLLPIMLLFTCFGGVKALLRDGDTGWHIRTGEWILAHHQVPRTDLFSFTKPGQEWFAWEWLWDLSFGWLHLHWGLAAVVVASLVVICATSAMTFRLILLFCPNRLITIAVTGLAAVGCSIHWLARPHLFTILFVVLWMHVLERAYRGQAKWLWALPAGMVLWTNLHGGFLAGILLTATYALGCVLEAMFAEDSGAKRSLLRRAGLFAGAATLSLAASLINPYGWTLYRHLAEYLTDATQMDHISEFQSISFHQAGAKWFELMLLLSVLAAASFARRKRFVAGLLLLSWSHFALVSARHLPIFFVVAAPFVAAMLYESAQRFHEANGPDVVRRGLKLLAQIDADINGLETAPRVQLIATAVIVLLCFTVSNRAAITPLRSQYDAQVFPVGAVRAVSSVGLGHRIFSTDQWGDYLTYCLYPKSRVFIDGRSDFFGGKFVSDYLEILHAKYPWQQRLSRYGVDILVLPTGSPIAEVAKFSPEWQVTYDDGFAIVFKSTSPASKFPTIAGNKGEARLQTASVN